MGINDPITVEYNERRESFVLMQGNETFYDYENYLIEFETAAEAREFAIENLGIIPKEGELCSTQQRLPRAVQLGLDLAL
jgi:hypothetical protein